MSVTSGFYNSLDGDRTYNAEQMSALFDGIINDGILANIGTCFVVTVSSGYTVNVGIGRAWFNSTWIYNDAILPVTLDSPGTVLARYDAVVIEVDRSTDVRAASIKVINGTQASKPSYPELEDSDYVHQYPLAYIYRTAGESSISASNITNMVGTEDTPFVTGILEVISLDEVLGQWEAELDEFVEEQESDFSDWSEEFQSTWNTWVSSFESTAEDWYDETIDELTTYVNSIELELDEDTVTEMQSQINYMYRMAKILLRADDWVGTTAPYYQTVKSVIINSTDNPFLVSLLSHGSSINTQKAYMKAFSIIAAGTAVTSDGSVTFNVYKKPETDISVGLRFLGGYDDTADATEFLLVDSDGDYIVDSDGETILTTEEA